MATSKTFRLGDNAIKALEILKEANPGNTNTSIVETALINAAEHHTTRLPTSVLCKVHDVLTSIDTNGMDDETYCDIQYCISAIAEWVPDPCLTLYMPPHCLPPY